MSFRIKYLLFVILSHMCLICVFKFICLVTSFGINPLISKPNCPIHNPNTPLPKTPKITPHLFPHARHAYLEKQLAHLFHHAPTCIKSSPPISFFLIRPLAEPLLSWQPTCIWKQPLYTVTSTSHHHTGSAYTKKK